jgi:hypothetical protein
MRRQDAGAWQLLENVFGAAAAAGLAGLNQQRVNNFLGGSNH